MITVEPNPPPWRNDVDELEDTVENDLDESLICEESAPQPPVFRWSTTFQATSQVDPAKPFRCRTLVMAFSHTNDLMRPCCPQLNPTSWVASVFTPGVSVRGNKVDPLHPDNKACQLFQVGRKEDSTLLLLCGYDIPSDSLPAWADVVMSHVAPEQVIVLDAVSRAVKSYPSPWSHLWPSTERASHLRTLTTSAWKLSREGLLPPMEVGRPVMGPTAALMGYCEMRSLPAMAVLLFVLPGPSHELQQVLKPLWTLVKDVTSGVVGLPDTKRAEGACRKIMKVVGWGGNDDELLYI